MKTWKHQFVQILFVLLSTAAFVYSQQGLAAVPINVVDGRTVKVRTTTGQELTVRLRLIAVPGEGDPMAESVKRHLAMHLGAAGISLVELRLQQDVVVAGVFAKGVDISMQMLRDGAAWYEPSADGSSPEGAEYARQEQLAKADGLGVWSAERSKATVATPTPAPASPPKPVRREGLNQFDLNDQKSSATKSESSTLRPAAKGSPREAINGAFETIREMIGIIRSNGSQDYYFELHDKMRRHLALADSKLKSRPIGAVFDDLILSFQGLGNAYGSVVKYGAIPNDPYNPHPFVREFGITTKPHPRFGQAIFKDDLADAFQRFAEGRYRSLDALLADGEKKFQ